MTGEADGVPLYCKNGCALSPTDTSTNIDPTMGLILYDKHTVRETSRDLYFRCKVNLFMKYDTTLPRKTGVCKACNQSREILHVKYDPLVMRYLYMCDDPACRKFWHKTDGTSSVSVDDLPDILPDNCLIASQTRD